MSRPLLLVASAMLAACTGPTVALEVHFPSETAFVATSVVDFDIVPLTTEYAELGRCPSLLAAAQAAGDLGATVSVAGVTRCDVRRGAPLPDPGAGPHAFIVQARSQSSATLLVGCAIGEAYPGGPPVRVDLFPTDAYAAVATSVPPGSTAEGACP